MTASAVKRSSSALRIEKLARWAGGLYVATIFLGFLGQTAKGPLSVGADIAGSLGYVAVTVLLYELFKLVSRTLSLVAAIFSLAGCVAFAFFGMHRYGLPINPMVFFGLYCLMIGYLIVRSGLLPRTIAVLISLTGVGWLSFAVPWVVAHLATAIMVAGLVGEGSLALWLLFRGVRDKNTHPSPDAAG